MKNPDDHNDVPCTTAALRHPSHESTHAIACISRDVTSEIHRVTAVEVQNIEQDEVTALRAVEVLGVVGSPLKKKGKPVPKEQIGLFEE